MRSATVIEAEDSSGDEGRMQSAAARRTYGTGGGTTTTSSTSPLRIYQVAGCTGKYTDVVSASIQSVKRVLLSPKSKRKGPRGGVSETFPTKLYEMLVGLELESQLEDNHRCRGGGVLAASWRDHGRCFEITDPHNFAQDVMPRFFKQTKVTSFQRQLNLYGFQRVSSGVDKGCFYHPLFLRGRPDICRIMLRTRVKGNYGTVTREGDAKIECHSFYDLPPCPPAGAPITTTSAEDVEEGQQQQLPARHHAVSLPSSPHPSGETPYVRFFSSAGLPVTMPLVSPQQAYLSPSPAAAAAVPYTLPSIPYPDDNDLIVALVQQQDKRQQLIVQQHQQQPVEPQQPQQQLERTPHYEYVPAAAAVQPENSNVPGHQSDDHHHDGGGEYYGIPNHHFDTASTSTCNAVSPTNESFSQHVIVGSNVNNANGWFPVFPEDVVAFPAEDNDAADYESDDFPTWGGAFQCMNDDDIQAYERCIERRYRPCQP